ncbi:hypothetical protein FSP39_000017 [Pinctada imbricata]|uniref:FAS1 domain-containing protein n=1 Tax=Pinctada imbricata TaxID=66713 RepID=A0AA88Y723_PINIB|nr:hypothetical protein FSP39_000017 [Pinctada imbricata]
MYILSLFAVLGLAYAQPPNPTNASNVVDLIKPIETTLAKLIDAAGLTDILSQGGPFTIFAPDDRAFAALGQDTLDALGNDTKKLGDILKYHVVSGIIKYQDLHSNEMMLDSLLGQKIRVNYYYTSRRTVTVEGSRIVYPDKMGSNGVIHRINKVMLPPAGNIVEVLKQDGNFSTLLTAVGAAGLSNFFLQEGPYTLMAPTDHAFERLGTDLVNKLVAKPDLLAKILKYHVIHGTLYSAGMHSGTLHTFDEDDRERVYASFFGTLIDGHRVMKPDISATNGVVHKLDYVLVPNSVKSEISSL